jgi:hypothetical protein
MCHHCGRHPTPRCRRRVRAQGQIHRPPTKRNIRTLWPERAASRVRGQGGGRGGSSGRERHDRVDAGVDGRLDRRTVAAHGASAGRFGLGDRLVELGLGCSRDQ